ncbi:MAG: M28 family peptidase [Planctomycetaceae bacterium]|nr:M28 family peptidase [Planctomycetaceae bacterium]
MATTLRWIWPALLLQVAATTGGTGTERALAALVDDNRAAAHVRLIVALGARMGGTDSGARANAVRRAAFERLGLTAWTESDGELWNAEERSWSLVAHTEAGPRAIERSWPYGFSPPVAGRFALTAGDGDSPAQLLRTAPRRRAENPPKVVLVDGRNTSVGDWPQISRLAPGAENPTAVFGIPSAEGAWLRAELEAGRKVELEAKLETVIRKSDVATVFARIPAAEGAPPGYLLFSAHGDADSGGPGANDNGSGEAIVFEIAGAFAKARAAGLVPAPPRELRFAIWGAEIHSSKAHRERALAEGAEPMLGLLNFDQSGYGVLGDRLYLEPDDEPHHAALLAALLAVLNEHSGQPGFPTRWATVKSLGGTDSYVFSQSPAMRERGVPALTLYASAWGRQAAHPRTKDQLGMSDEESERVVVDHDPYYHSAGDLPALTTDLQPYFLGWNARVGLLGGLRWLEGLDG